MVGVSPEVLVEAQAQLLDLAVERDILAESEVKIGEKTDLSSRPQRIGLDDEFLFPFRVVGHDKGHFLDEALFRKPIFVPSQL
jgi:hypothetical protein